MSWGKLDDGWHSHPKTIALPLEAVALDALAISHVAQHELDGEVAVTTAVHLARGNRTDLFDALVNVGRWERTETGFLIHNYLEYNPSASSLLKARNESKKRVAAYRKRNEKVRRDTTHHDTENTGSGRVGSGTTPRSVSPRSGSTRARVTSWHVVPDGETLTDARRAYAEAQGIAPDAVPGLWQDFTEYDFQRARHDVTKTWQTWCRKEARDAKARVAASARPSRPWVQTKTAGNAAAVAAFAAKGGTS